MAKLSPLVATTEPNVARAIQDLSRQGGDADRRAQPSFRHEVAYALQDLEKTTTRIEINPALRAELTKLAGSAVGLENERMVALVGITGELQDRGLIRDIRRAAKDFGQQVDQTTTDIQSRIEVIENRFRLAQRRPEPQAEASKPSGQPDAGPKAAGHQRPPDETQTGPQRSDGPHVHGGQQGQQVLIARTPLDAIFSSLWPAEKPGAAPWEPPPTPMKERIAAFEQTMQGNRDEEVLGRAEKQGRAALDAVQAFSAGEGAIVMNRIREAARSDPGGMAGVLSEMKEGGRFADLRQQFNNALFDERGVSAAYDRAFSALARYGETRQAIEPIVARRPDAANLTAKFEQMDAAIGEAAGKTPSRSEGKSMMDDLAKSASEILQRAVEGVKSMFSRTPAAEAPARPSPSP